MPLRSQEFTKEEQQDIFWKVYIQKVPMETVAKEYNCSVWQIQEVVYIALYQRFDEWG